MDQCKNEGCLYHDENMENYCSCGVTTPFYEICTSKTRQSNIVGRGWNYTDTRNVIKELKAKKMVMALQYINILEDKISMLERSKSLAMAKIFELTDMIQELKEEEL